MNHHSLSLLTLRYFPGLADAGLTLSETTETSRGWNMNSAFDFWIGEQVVVRLDLGQIKMSVRGSLLEERTDTIMIRTNDGAEVEIYKTMVLAVEEGKAPTPRSYRLTA